MRKSRAGATRSVGVAKYRDPDTGKTWTGRGMPPAWIAVAIKEGRKDDFLIDKAPAPAAAAPPAARRTAQKGARETGRPKARGQREEGRQTFRQADAGKQHDQRSRHGQLARPG